MFSPKHLRYVHILAIIQKKIIFVFDEEIFYVKLSLKVYFAAFFNI